MNIEHANRIFTALNLTGYGQSALSSESKKLSPIRGLLVALRSQNREEFSRRLLACSSARLSDFLTVNGTEIKLSAMGATLATCRVDFQLSVLSARGHAQELAAALREKNTHACVTTLRADGASGFCAECGASLC